MSLLSVLLWSLHCDDHSISSLHLFFQIWELSSSSLATVGQCGPWRHGPQYGWEKLRQVSSYVIDPDSYSYSYSRLSFHPNLFFDSGFHPDPHSDPFLHSNPDHDLHFTPTFTLSFTITLTCTFTQTFTLICTLTLALTLILTFTHFLTLKYHFLLLSLLRCEDYYGIRLVQQLRAMPDKMKARAEVAVYMHNFDEAEAIYRYVRPWNLQTFSCGLIQEGKTPVGAIYYNTIIITVCSTITVA